MSAIPYIAAQSFGQPQGNSEQTVTVNLLRGDQVKIQPVAWLWHGWLARGKLHILAGMPGTGKTTIASDLAARLTIGGNWPDGTKALRGGVLIWSGEDDPNDRDERRRDQSFE